MITEQAIVTRREGRRIELELLRQSACDPCQLKQGCGTGSLGRLLGHRRRPLVLETEQALQPGDRVEIGLAEAALVKASLLVYGLPLAGLILFGMSAVSLNLADWLVALASLAGLFAGHRAAAMLGGRLASMRWTPQLLNIDVNPGALSES